MRSKLIIDNKEKEIKKINKFQILNKYIKNKNVLDIGCAGHKWQKGLPPEKRERWLHGFIYRNSKRCVGIDIDKREIELLNKYGYECYHLNAEKPFNLGEKYDVIIASQMMYYITNLDQFFLNIKNHLKNRGVFIPILPNIFYVGRLLLILKFKNPELPNRTIGSDPVTTHHAPASSCMLLKRYNFDIEEIYWVYEKRGIFRRIITYIWDYFEPEFLIIGRKRE